MSGRNGARITSPETLTELSRRCPHLRWAWGQDNWEGSTQQHRSPPFSLTEQLNPHLQQLLLIPTEAEICPSGIKDLADAMPIADRNI